MIFLTAGTQFPFDRLVNAVDRAIDNNLIDEEIFAQIGGNSYTPRNFKSVNFLDKSRFDSCIRQSSAIISHAGMGTITIALEHEKPLLVMPRQKKYGEAVNDHQIAIAKRLEELNHFLVAYDERELPDKIKELRTFIPTPRKAEPKKVAAKIAEYLDSIGG